MHTLSLVVGFFTATILYISIYFIYISPRIKLFKYTDRQTNLFNLDYLLKILKTIDDKYFLVLIDIDNFKRYNLEHNYKKGDMVLFELISLIKTNIAQYNGYAFRYRNGDEFLILIKTSKMTYANLRELLLNIKNNLIFNEEIITLSMGVSDIANHLEVEECIKNLESALNRSKTRKDSAYYLSPSFKEWIYTTN